MCGIPITRQATGLKKAQKGVRPTMDEQQQQRVNQAAEEFSDALKQSFQAVSERGQSAYEVNAQLTQESLSAYMDFVNSGFSFAQQGPREAQRGAERAT